MAVTKTHPIKSTLKAAIDYILNPEKTDGKLLASSFGCGLETADIEFAWTREAAGDRGTHLGRHLIQSFAVGETTPEEAHKIGMELAGAVLGGKYEFVLTTHVDKDHLHNHLIFNAVSFVDYKKYHSNKQSYHFIRRTSDRICKEHGLSVVVPGQDKGKSYAEYLSLIHILDGMEEDALEQGDMPDVLVDAMFGTGFHGVLRGNGLKAAEYINNCHEKYGKKVFALDIPSGLGGDQLKKKKIPCEIIKADYTITFHARKPVHMRRFAARYCGEILVADIGIDEEKLMTVEI